LNSQQGNYTESSVGFGVKNLLEAVQTEDFQIYKDLYETAVYFRDRVTGKAMSPPYFSFGANVKHTFRVLKSNISQNIYDMVVCSRDTVNRTENCSLFAIDTTRKTNGSTIGYTRLLTFNLSNDQCATNIVLKQRYMVVSCPRFGYFQGQI
jgi:hypothetical protein